MINDFRTSLSRNITNARGWRTNRKIVVIESDDWGAIRMPNIDVNRVYEKLGYSINKNPYCKFDTLASSEDLEALFDTLSKFKDKDGNSVVMTLNTVVGNPAFKKIEDSKFEEYFFEPFTDTLKHYFPKENVFDLWRQGINSGLIQPQYHGREHVNVPLWLEELKRNNKPLTDAFHLNFWGIPEDIYEPLRLNIQASYDSDKKEHLDFYKTSIREGLELFKNIFGFNSKTFIANNYTWPSSLNEELHENSVKGLQGMKYQKLPIDNVRGIREKNEVFTGKTNSFGQTYTVRNCIFEPSHFNANFDNVGKCLSQIQQAFFFKKPAIITSHRLNYIGSLHEKNRTTNLEYLNSMLQSITKKWPEVEFLSSDQLIETIIM